MTTPQVRSGALRRSESAEKVKSDHSGGGVLAIKGRLLEWHAMSPAQRSEAWTGLVEWVAWLYERYELSLEYRLPDCWTAHPGIIEELWALKCWREALYTTDAETGVVHGADAGGLAQHARYWHTDLRNLFGQIKFYARRCTAGHKGGEPLANHRNPNLKTEWLEADPLHGISGPARQPRPDKGKAVAHRLTESEMDRRLRSGAARSPGGALAEYVYSLGDWWVAEEPTGGDWLKVTDPQILARLEAARRTADPRQP